MRPTSNFFRCHGFFWGKFCHVVGWHLPPPRPTPPGLATLRNP